jgi:class 3 adenylate cyclase
MGSLLSITDSSNSLSAYGKINDKDQSGKFYVKVEADFGILFTNRTEIYYKFLLYSSVIITVLTALLILSMLNITRVIKKVTNTVKNIADGDLTSRINYKSKDELGEISSQVNEMAVNLEKSFEEKDRTEKFYYKFVPEKFREYLSKESFTDLALGDASSRELTVLFCDIRAFSINSEIMTTKENFAFVNTIYGKAGPIIREHNGFVDKYIGDAVMALFENADDAVKCGIDLYRAIVLDPETAKELKVSDINIGIGIHTGMAMIGIVGESERLSGTVISDTVNLSSRLESLTKQYKTAILVSKDTIDRLSDPDSLGLRYLGMIQVAGVNEVKGVYEVLDCLQEDIKKVRSENCPEFREAVRLFQMGRRDDARKALEKIDEEGRSDYVSKMYLDYIKGLSADDKSNVFRFTRK